MGGLESRPSNTSNDNSNILKREFGNAFTSLVLKRGYRNIAEYAFKIGGKSNFSNAFTWASGRRCPRTDSMSIILQTLNPEGEELDQLINPWGRLLETELTSTGKSKSGSESALRSSKAKRKESKNPFGKWIDTIADDLKITLRELSVRLGISRSLLSGWKRKGIPTLDHISFLLERVQERLDLSKEQEESLRDAIAKTIEEAYKKGDEIGSAAPNSLVKIVQIQTTQCVTYTGGQAAEKLGDITRQRVKQLRREVGISNTLLTEADIKRIKKYRSLSTREKRKFREQVQSS